MPTSSRIILLLALALALPAPAAAQIFQRGDSLEFRTDSATLRRATRLCVERIDVPVGTWAQLRCYPVAAARWDKITFPGVGTYWILFTDAAGAIIKRYRVRLVPGRPAVIA